MKTIQIYNTQKRTKEDFKPIKENEVGIYVCGVTVYDFCHIGHGRAYVVFDTIRRFLEYAGYKVKYVQNFTDIDDKIINRSKETGTEWDKLSSKFINEYYTDMDALNIKRADIYPKATEHIKEMHDLITILMNKGIAYEIEGDVYFSITDFPEYGQLSGRILEDMQAGARIEVDKRKKHPMDFALWKKAETDDPGWDSPWGHGRPGWHIECSAMSSKYLGQPFDIHGGGADLTFPHHENELAQSKAAYNKDFAKYWMHNGFVNIDKQKMSKSLNNFFTIRDVLGDYSPEVLRLFYLMTQYRKPINYSLDQLKDATKAYERIVNALNIDNTSDKKNADKLGEFRDKFITSMSDDFNTAGALGTLFDLVRYINSEKDSKAQDLLKELCDVLGIKIVTKKNDIPQEVVNLATQRKQAKADKDWSTADSIRDKVTQMGYMIKDTKDGFTIEKV